MANNSIGKALANPATTSATSDSLTRNRVEWTVQEENFLLDEFVSRKDILHSAHDPSVTREQKKEAWKEIHEALALRFPNSCPKTCSQVKKKWDNLNREARAEVVKYNASMSGTGEGTEYQFKKPIYKKIFENVIGVNNAAVLHGGIDGGVESDTASTSIGSGMGSTQFSNVSTSTVSGIGSTQLSNVRYIEDHSNHVDNDNVMEILPDIAVFASTETLENRISPLTSTSESTSSSSPKTTSSTTSATKRNIFQISDQIGSKRVKIERFTFLNVVMESRNRLGVPVTMEEIPEDLYEIMMNLKDHI